MGEGVWRKDFVQLNSVGSQGNSCDGVVTMKQKFFRVVVSLKIRQSTIYYAGLLGRWDKRIVNQE